MFNVIIVMITGMILGVLLHKSTIILKASEKIITYAIWLLLLLLGISVGSNSLVMDNIGSLGIKALILSLSATLGSVLLSFLVYNLFFKDD